MCIHSVTLMSYKKEIVKNTFLKLQKKIKSAKLFPLKLKKCE